VLLALSSTGKKTRSFLKCMSFVPAPQQANAAGSNNAPSNNQVTTSNAAAAATETSDMEAVFKIRTFDVYWVDKTALMYRDGIDKVCSCAEYNGA
jgi:ATP-dependent RNA helicase DDX60